jgi:hypothetical protein
VKEGEVYTVLFAKYLVLQGTLGFQLNEIMLDEYCAPYEYFQANRFAFNKEDLEELIEFIQHCNDISISMDELLKKTDTIDYDIAT